MNNLITATATIAATATAASASFTVTPNDSVSFAGANFDAVIAGSSGIPNSNLEVARNADEDIEIGLSAIERFIGNLPTTGAGDTYLAPIGDDDDPGNAEWNYVLVADFGDRTIGDFDIQFDIDFNPAFNAASFTTIDVDAEADLLGFDSLSTYGDSQNLGFSFWQLLYGAPAFDPNAAGEYDFIYTVFEKGTSNILAQTDITVVVPTPGTAGVLAIAGLAAARRRR